MGQDNQELQKNLEAKLNDLVASQQRYDQLEDSMQRQKLEQDQIAKELRQERDAAQQQLSDFVNQTKFEKESIEGKLQHQLNQTLATLDKREDENEALQA